MINKQGKKMRAKEECFYRVYAFPREIIQQP